MIYPEMYLNLTYNQKVIFAICVIIFVSICVILTKMKNKARKTIKKQIIYLKTNLDLFEYIIKDKKIEFIGQNKMYKNELRRL